MPLSLIQTQHIAKLTDALYSFLPGTSQWGAYTFAHAASEVGVGSYWTTGISKTPAINALLEQTFELKIGRFVPLVELVVRQGLKYRNKRGEPVTREEVVAIHRLIRELALHSVALGSETFLSALPTAAVTEDTSSGWGLRPAEKAPSQSVAISRTQELASLQNLFSALIAEPDRQAAGRALEQLLNKLFRLEGLNPRDPFRIVGEQIDGSFEFGSNLYLLEAKWTSAPTPVEELYVFREKVAGKSSFTRGVFISINGFVSTASDALTRGKQPNFVMLDGTHLYSVLSGALGLSPLLDGLVRYLLERGEPYVPMLELQSRG
jgi:hypothetical protein